MLTIKTNKNNCKLTYSKVRVRNIYTGDTVNDDITIRTNGGHNLRENDEVVFIRQDGESISYSKNLGVKNVIDKNRFTVDGFGKYLVEVNGYKPSFIKYSDNIFKMNNVTIVVTNSYDFLITGNTLNNGIISNAATEASVNVWSIISISISSEITYISDDSFVDCIGLQQIDVSANNRNYISENGVLFNKDKTELICYPGRKTGDIYEIPTTVEKISNNAFVNAARLSQVTIPSFVEKIGDSAFNNNRMSTVICKPIDPPIITDTTFNKLVLTKIKVNEEQIRRYKTAWKKLKSKIEGYNSITDDVKVNQKNTRLYLNGQTDFIEITGTTLDSSVITPYRSSLTSVEIGTDVTTIGYLTFGNCPLLLTVNIPNTVTKINNYAFYNCPRLSLINIPDSVSSIGDYAFSLCLNLIHIFLGKNVKYIGKHAFHGIYAADSTSVANVYCASNEPPILGDSEVFMTKYSHNPKFYVPGDVLNNYKGVYMHPNSFEQLNYAEEKKYICLNTNEHIFATNKDNVEIKRKYVWDTNSGEYKYDGALVLCDLDYCLFDSIFLIRNDGGVTDGNIILDITATTIGYEPILLTNCLIGVNFDGKDNRYHIYIPFNENSSFINALEDRLPITTFITDNIRFLRKGINQMKFGQSLQPGTQIVKVCGNIEVDFTIGENFDVNLHHDEQVNNYTEKVKNSSINKIIDYERQQYTPMYYAATIPETEEGADAYLKSNSDKIDANLKQVKKIEFDLFFRAKDYTLYDYNGEEIDRQLPYNNQDVDYVDFGTWETKDDEYWNSYHLRNDHTYLDYTYPNYNLYGDLLGFLGFTDDDVYYQKDALKKSFLRLSFYDSPNRETQKLLYYSTIYFDTNNLSQRYIKDLSAWRESTEYIPRYNQLVFAYDIVKNFSAKGTSGLTAELTCTDKYDDTSSSDGFYIHLFDKLVSGNTCTPIYVKAEFNNAKFGKTVPMIRPVMKKTNQPISATAESFPREYIKAKKNNGQTYTWTDMDMLMRDMYIKIFIKYDFKTNQYVWFVPQNGLGDTITFKLFEPRINGYDFDSYDTLINDNSVGYGTDDGKPNWFDGEFNEDHAWVNSDGLTEDEWARTFDGCSLLTTATTIHGESMLKGTKLINKSVLDKVSGIWIDGMEVKANNVYDSTKQEYTTVNLQLPDIPFTATAPDGEFVWEPDTTQEYWDSDRDEWVEGVTQPRIIHRVNYYFKPTNANVTELFDELYLGTYNEKRKKRLPKTIETTQDVVSNLKAEFTDSKLTNGEKLPNGMFCNVRSLRCVKTVKNNGHSFTTIGNGAFNNCQSLVRVNVDSNSLDIIGKNCFAGCRSIKSVDLSNVKLILKEAFQGCYTLTTVSFSSGLKYIGCAAFGYTKLRSFKVPSSVIRIGNSAFRRCYQLKSFYFAENSSLQTIGKRVFADCTVLKYNLGPNGIKRLTYTYYGGTPEILVTLVNSGAYIQFYDARNSKHKILAFSTEKDRGKTQYHFQDSAYREYCEEKGPYVYNFQEWLAKIF